MQPSGKVALVTGAGSGIGRASVLALAQAGFHVVLAGRRTSPLREVAALAREQGVECRVKSADVTDPTSVRALFGTVQRVFGRLDLLFNNAGISAPAVSLEELTYEQWRAVLDTSLTGAFLCTQEAFKLMKRQTPTGGRIINNGSISAHVPRPNSAPYTAAKHGMTGLTKSTSLDGRAHGITCGQIDIGNAGTDMTEKMKRGVIQANGTVAIEPTIDVSEVARAVVFMATLPAEVNVPFITVMANGMPYMGRG